MLLDSSHEATYSTMTANVPPPSFSSAPSGCKFADFQPLTVNDVTAAIRLLPDKHCASDPIPTSLLKDCADVLVPFIVELYNKSLRTGSVPAVFKAAYITPLLKKSDFDPADVRCYRPISNLSVISKLFERPVEQTAFGLSYSGETPASTTVGLPSISLHGNCSSKGPGGYSACTGYR